jgi:hypothetical protein
MKTTLRYFTSTGMAIINKTREASVDEDIEKWNPRAFLEGM